MKIEDFFKQPAANETLEKPSDEAGFEPRFDKLLEALESRGLTRQEMRQQIEAANYRDFMYVEKDDRHEKWLTFLNQKMSELEQWAMKTKRFEALERTGDIETDAVARTERVADIIRDYVGETTRDGLTGMLRKGALERLVSSQLGNLEREQRNENIKPYLIIVDIDRFKNVNDSKGHNEGDKVIAEIANIVRSGLRGTDEIVERHGGDEFKALIFAPDDETALRIVEEKVRIPVSKKIVDFSGATVSIGVAPFQPEDTFEEVTRRADVAMYAAKGNSKDPDHGNKVMFWDENMDLNLRAKQDESEKTATNGHDSA